jgi:hypothetical protein
VKRQPQKARLDIVTVGVGREVEKDRFTWRCEIRYDYYPARSFHDEQPVGFTGRRFYANRILEGQISKNVRQLVTNLGKFKRQAKCGVRDAQNAALRPRLWRKAQLQNERGHTRA